MKTINKKTITTFSITFLAVTLLMMPATSGTAFADHTTTVSSGESTVAYNGNCYAYIGSALNFGNAFADAQTKSVNGISGHLATLNSANEEAAADSASATRGWIGYTQDPAFYGDAGQLDGDLFGWITGETPLYTNWNLAIPEPSDDGGNEDYVENNRVGTFWNDLDDTDVNDGYFVEFEGACPDVDDEVCDDTDQLCKTVVITELGVDDGIIEVNELIQYDYTIDLNNNDGQTWFNVILQDHGFGADTNVGDPVIVDENSNWSVDDMILDNLDCELTQSNNKSHKEKLDCIVDDIEDLDTINPDGDLEFSDGEHASVSVTAYTDINPGQGKKAEPKREYTSCGIHSPNSGAEVEYYLDEEAMDGPYFLETPAIYVEVYDEADLSGDCDEDTVIDADDNCPFTPNVGQEDNYGTDLGDACEDTDSDNILDDTDKCPEDAEDVDGILDADGCPDTEVTFIDGWDTQFGDPSNSYVSYSKVPTNDLDVLFHFEGVTPGTYQVGIHNFPDTYPADCHATFGQIDSLGCGGSTTRELVTVDAIEAFEFGNIVIDGAGNGEVGFWITGIDADTYEVEFHVREGVGCIAGGNCAVIFQAPGPFGTTESITIP